MKHATRIAALGLLTGSAIALAAGAAMAHGRMGPQGMGFGPGNGLGMGFGPGGRLFATAFADLDTDGNGLITEEDLAAAAQARFDAADADGNGSLSAAELKAHIAAQMTARMNAMQGAATNAPATGTDDTTANNQAPAAGVPGRPMGPGMGRFGNVDPDTVASNMAYRMLQARDANQDGVLTPDELGPRVPFARTIDRWDTDDDNAISQSEYDAAKAEMGARFAQMGPRGGQFGGQFGGRMGAMRGGQRGGWQGGPQGGWGQPGYGMQGNGMQGQPGGNWAPQQPGGWMPWGGPQNGGRW